MGITSPCVGFYLVVVLLAQVSWGSVCTGFWVMCWVRNPVCLDFSSYDFNFTNWELTKCLPLCKSYFQIHFFKQQICIFIHIAQTCKSTIECKSALVHVLGWHLTNKSHYKPESVMTLFTDFTEAETNWLSISWRHSQIHFLNENI